MALRYEEVGDKYDKVKWDFDETKIPIYIIDKYPYKAFSEKNAIKLKNIRDRITDLCINIEKDRKKWENGKYSKNIELFLSIHEERYHTLLPEPFYYISLNGLPTSLYLISEMPKGTVYDGLDKPKGVHYVENAEPIGKDGKLRCLYRDIFLNLSTKGLTELIIHELAHTMANHVRYRHDDHHKDFKDCENIIRKYWHFKK